MVLELLVIVIVIVTVDGLLTYFHILLSISKGRLAE